MWKIIFRLQQRFNLQNPARILLFRHDSIIFPFKQKKVKIDLPKRPIGSHRNTYLPLHTACRAAPLEHDQPLQQQWLTINP